MDFAEKFLLGVGSLAVVLVVGAAFGLILAWPAQWLWNESLVPAVSFAKPITWVQAWGIMILCSLLFKGSSSSKS